MSRAHRSFSRLRKTLSASQDRLPKRTAPLSQSKTSAPPMKVLMSLPRLPDRLVRQWSRDKAPYSEISRNLTISIWVRV